MRVGACAVTPAIFVAVFDLVNENRHSEEPGKPSFELVTSTASPNGMPGHLLIAWQNGRPVKTYGVNRTTTCTMKIALICITAVISCSVCVSGELEIYPGLKYNLNRDERRTLLNNYDDDNFDDPDYKRYPWQNDPMEAYRDIDLPEIIRQLYGSEFEPPQSRHSNHHPRYENTRHHYEFGEVHKQFKGSDRPHFKSYTLGIPNTQILDDVRMYPQEDDFSFKNDDDTNEADDIQKAYIQPDLDEQERLLEKIELIDGAEGANEGMHHEHREAKLTSEEEFPSGPYWNAKVMDDPSEFAYLPTDPRFFGKHDLVTLDTGSREQKPETVPDTSTSENPFKVKSRSDQNLKDDSPGKVDSLSFKSSNGDVLSGSRVDVVAVKPSISEVNSAGVYIIAIVAGISAAATVGLIAVAIGWYNLQKHVKNASDVEYPAYGVTGPNKDVSPSGDRRLAQSAQMYHYQHQKQQIIAMERAPPGDRHASVSDADSDEENEEGDYTVYECPGLAPTGEMEVKNPLFQDDPTPAQTPAIKPNDETK